MSFDEFMNTLTLGIFMHVLLLSHIRVRKYRTYCHLCHKKGNRLWIHLSFLFLPITPLLFRSFFSIPMVVGRIRLTIIEDGHTWIHFTIALCLKSLPFLKQRLLPSFQFFIVANFNSPLGWLILPGHKVTKGESYYWIMDASQGGKMRDMGVFFVPVPFCHSKVHFLTQKG